MVGRHQLDREPREDALATVLPLAQHHLTEREIVVDGRDQSAAAGLEDRRARPQAAAGFIEHREPAGPGTGLVTGRQSVELRLGYAKRRVPHTERLEDA